MLGSPIEDAKNALLASLSNLNPEDTFNIIAFNGEIDLFSPSMELATKEAISKATEWVDANLVANGGTNISLPMEQVSYSVNRLKVITLLLSIFACTTKSS